MPPESGGAPTEVAGSVSSGGRAGEFPVVAAGPELANIRRRHQRHQQRGQPCQGGHIKLLQMPRTALSGGHVLPHALPMLKCINEIV